MESYFPKMNTLEAAQKALRGGGIAGLVITGMTVLAAVLVFFSGAGPGEEPYATNEDQMYSLIGNGIEAALILFLTWRLWAGHGYVSGIILLSLFLFESVLKVTSGSAGTGWILIYLAIAAALLNGIRAALAYKRVVANVTAAEAF